MILWFYAIGPSWPSPANGGTDQGSTSALVKGTPCVVMQAIFSSAWPNFFGALWLGFDWDTMAKSCDAKPCPR